MLKTPSTPNDPSRGFITGFSKILKARGIAYSQVRRIFQGSTIAANAVLEGKTHLSGRWYPRGSNMSWRSDATPWLGWPTPTSGSSRNVRYPRSASLKFRNAPPSMALSSAPWTKTQCDWRRPALSTKEVVADQTEPGPHLGRSTQNDLPNCRRRRAVRPGINAKPA